MSTIGDRIRILRERQGYTQSELGNMINVSSRVIGNWEKSINNPGVDNLVDLCVALSTTPAFLLDYPDEDDLTESERSLIENYRKIDRRGQESIQAMIHHELGTEKDLFEVTAQLPSVHSNISSDLQLFLTRKDPLFEEMRQKCSELDALQKSAGYSDLDVAHFMWRVGLSQFSGGTMYLIRTKLRVPTPELANIITCYLTGNYNINIPACDSPNP